MAEAQTSIDDPDDIAPEIPRASRKPSEPLSVIPIKAAKSALKGSENLGFVMDVPVELRVELGRRKSRIGDLLRLGAGSVLELDKPNGEPLDLYVNDRLVARGEAVVIGERYGIRLTEVLIDNGGEADG